MWIFTQIIKKFYFRTASRGTSYTVKKSDLKIVWFLLVCLEYRLQISNYFQIIYFTFKFHEKLKEASKCILMAKLFYLNFRCSNSPSNISLSQLFSWHEIDLRLKFPSFFLDFAFFFFLQILVEVKVITQTLIIECLWVGRDRALPTEWIYG